jgi:hypothetical protein
LSAEDIQWPTIKKEENNNLVAMQTEPEHKQSSQDTVKLQNNENIINENVIIVTEEKDPLLE